MIELVYQNGIACVYEVDDWELLRKNHRIIGELLGNTSFLPVLPLKLMPEEAWLLIEKGIAKLVAYENLAEAPTVEERNKNKLADEHLKESLQGVYTELRKRQLEGFIDKIVEAKRSKNDNRSKEEIFDEEVKKSSSVTDENMIYPNLLKCAMNNPVEIEKDCLLGASTIGKCSTFRDLWDKGYYITSGSKFGGDFLVYEGDPILYHAVHIVRCVEDQNKGLNPSEIVAFGRLANSVKKKAILASYSNNVISYITVSWPHM